MKKITIFNITFAIVCVILMGSCGTSRISQGMNRTYQSTATSENASQFANTTVISYNEYTMDLDEETVEYTIDISTREGKTKLYGLSLQEAQKLALVEAIMFTRCATIHQPQYTQLVRDGHVLRVTVYGTPARYKKKVQG